MDADRFRFQVHHLVLVSHRGPRPADLCCRHLNGNSKDNRLSNLAWGTHRENAMDREFHGTQTRGETHSTARLTEEQATSVWIGINTQGLSAGHFARKYGIHRETARMIARGMRWGHIDRRLSKHNPSRR